MDCIVDLTKEKKQPDSWTLIKPSNESVPSVRSKSSGVFWDRALWIFGGLSQSSDVFNDLWKFDFLSEKWSIIKTKGQIPSERFHQSTQLYKDSMYIFGGLSKNKNANNEIYELELKSQNWKKLETIGSAPKERSGHISVIYKDFIYIFGGSNGSILFNDLYSFNISNKEWKELSTTGIIPSPLENASAALHKSDLYIFAGRGGSGMTSDLFKINLDTLTWTILENTGSPSRRFGHVLICSGDFLYVFGGNCQSKLDSSLYSYNIENKKWFNIKETKNFNPSARSFPIFINTGDDAVLFGGLISEEDQKNNILSNEIHKFHFGEPLSPSSLTTDLGKLLKEGELFDVIICSSDKKEFMIHKAIVAARSGYFSLHFMSAAAPKKKKEGNQQEVLKVSLDENSYVVEKLLQFLYTDEIDFSNVAQDTVFRLAIVSKKYEVERLGIMCQNHICMGLNLSNVICSLKWSVTEKCKIVETFCYDFIRKNYNSVLILEEVATLAPQLLVGIMRMQQQVDVLSPLLEDVPASTYYDDFCTLYTDMDFSDFILVVRGEQISAHICMLAARSEYFNQMFKTKEVTNGRLEIKIKEMQPPKSAIDSFLKFIYYDNNDFDVENAVYQLPFSEFFCLSNKKLMEYCIKRIELNLEPKNLLQSLEAADSICFSKLKKQFLSEIVSHFVVVMESEYIEKMSNSLLVEILRALAVHQKQIVK